MARKKHLINVHTSTGSTAPTGASLYLGEIAVQHTPNEPALWIKMGSTEASTDYEKFIGQTEIFDILESSAATMADLEELSAAVVSNEYVTALALNDLDSRIDEISGNTGGGGGDVTPLSAAVLSLSAAVITISGNSGGGGTDITPLSSATYSHVTNNDIHVTANDKTAWNNNVTAVTELSAATTAHTSNTNIHVPTGGTNGQFLSLVNGAPAWTSPITVYSGANPPEQSLGNNGDIYLQTS